MEYSGVSVTWLCEEWGTEGQRWIVTYIDLTCIFAWGEPFVFLFLFFGVGGGSDKNLAGPLCDFCFLCFSLSQCARGSNCLSHGSNAARNLVENSRQGNFHWFCFRPFAAVQNLRDSQRTTTQCDRWDSCKVGLGHLVREIWTAKGAIRIFVTSPWQNCPFCLKKKWGSLCPVPKPLRTFLICHVFQKL